MTAVSYREMTYTLRSLVMSMVSIGHLSGCAGASIEERGSIDSRSSGGAVTIIEFGDYQCGPCSRMGRQLHALHTRRAGEVRLVYRHCPSQRHPIGRLAAIVAAAAEELGHFWELHWELIREGPIESEATLWEIVRDVGLEETAVRAIISTGRPEQIVTRDLAIADQHGVRGMPTTFINDHRIEGALSFERLSAVVDEAAGSR